MLRGRRPLRAYCDVRAHIAPCTLNAATPTAFHPRPSWAPDEIECRVLLKLPYTNLTPTLATALRETITAKRQIRAIVLREVDVLAAAQADVSCASRMVSVIEQLVFGRGFLQLFHLTAGLDPIPAFPSCWRAPGSIAGGLRGVWCRRFSVCDRLRAHAAAALADLNPFGTYVRRWPAWWHRLWLRRGRRIGTDEGKSCGSWAGPLYE